MNARTILIGVGILIIAIIMVMVFRNLVGSSFSLSPFGRSSVTIANHKFTVDIAKTETARQKGLSGKNSIAQDKGMLFVFDTAKVYPFWMHKMKFPIDIIYIFDNKVVTIIQDASADQSKLVYYYPTAPVNKVLEINAGLSRKYNFHEGDSVTISQ